jgi:hypothetical protein
MRDRDFLLAKLSAHRRTGTWCVVSGELPTGVTPMAMVVEEEGSSYVISLADATLLGLTPEFRAGWITLDVESSLAAVGLTAAVASALADEEIACNVLAGFHHDHLLVPEGLADRAVDVLNELGRAHRTLVRRDRREPG